MGFATWNEAVATARDRADWRKKVNGAILPEENDDDDADGDTIFVFKKRMNV